MSEFPTGKTKHERYLAKLEMKRMFEEEHKSLKQIGEHFGISKQAVSINLRSIGYFAIENANKMHIKNKIDIANQILLDKIKQRDKKINCLTTQLHSRNKKIQKLEEKINELLCNN